VQHGRKQTHRIRQKAAAARSKRGSVSKRIQKRRKTKPTERLTLRDHIQVSLRGFLPPSLRGCVAPWLRAFCLLPLAFCLLPSAFCLSFPRCLVASLPCCLSRKTNPSSSRALRISARSDAIHDFSRRSLALAAGIDRCKCGAQYRSEKEPTRTDDIQRHAFEPRAAGFSASTGRHVHRIPRHERRRYAARYIPPQAARSVEGEGIQC
jgi:hypothetical protein